MVGGETPISPLPLWERVRVRVTPFLPRPMPEVIPKLRPLAMAIQDNRIARSEIRQHGRRDTPKVALPAGVLEMIGERNQEARDEEQAGQRPEPAADPPHAEYPGRDQEVESRGGDHEVAYLEHGPAEGHQQTPEDG